MKVTDAQFSIPLNLGNGNIQAAWNEHGMPHTTLTLERGAYWLRNKETRELIRCISPAFVASWSGEEPEAPQAAKDSSAAPKAKKSPAKASASSTKG